MMDAVEHIQAEDRLAKAFKLDELFDAMTSGRLCGVALEEDVAHILLVLLERIGWKPNIAQLAFAMGHYPEQFGVAEIRSTMANIGYLSTTRPIRGDRLHLCPAHSLFCDEFGEIWLIRMTQDGVELFRPGVVESIEKVRPKTSYRSIQFEPRALNPTPEDSAAAWSSGMIFRFLPEFRMLLLLTSLSGLTIVLVAFGVKSVFDTVIPSRNTGTLEAIILGIGMVALAELTLRRLRAGVVARLAGRVEFVLGTNLFGKLLRLPGTMLTNASESDQFARLKQFESLRDVLGGPVVLLAMELCVAAILLLAIVLIAWQLAVLLACLALLFLVTALVLRPGITRANAALSAAQSRFNMASNEYFSCRVSIRRRGLYQTFATRQRDSLRALIRARRKLLAETHLLDSLSLVSLPIAGATVIGAGALMVMQGSLSSGQLIAATILTWRLFAPIQQTIQILPKLPELKRLRNQIDLFFKIPEGAKTQLGDATRPCRGDVSVNNLVVRFPGAILPTLMGGDFSVPGGKLIAIAGTSGSGKSTLLRVLSGSLPPQSGGVFVDGINLSQLSEGFRTRHIAYVAQRPIFIFGTVAQNLRLGAPDASDTRLEAIVDELGLRPWVQSLADGINTRIDPTTMTDLLSSGIRTQLSVAQALLADPAILLLDEPAGGLSGEQETSLLQAIRTRRGKMTTFLVTHRPSLIRQSDGLIFLERGAIRFKQTQPPVKATA